MNKKRTSADISNNIIKKVKHLDKSLGEIIDDNIDELEMKKRTRVRFEISKQTSQKIKRLKEVTGHPKWIIVERAIKNHIRESEISEQETERHIEPDQCPECGSTDLLISHADYSWMCHECGEDGYY